MCGRFTLTTSASDLATTFGVQGPIPDIRPRYNVAPAQEVPVVLPDEATGGRRLEMMRWGLVPSWSKEPDKGFINARSETVAEKPSFRAAFRERRALMPASGFFEWAKGTDGKKRPFHFRLKGGEPFAFAALWEEREGERTCLLLTTEANGVVAEVHHRMPVILPTDAYEPWTEADDPELLRSLLVPYPEAEMEGYEVSRRINSPGNEGDEALLAPASS